MFFSAMSLTASNTDAEGAIVWTAGSDFDLSISLMVFMFAYAAIVVPEDAVAVFLGPVWERSIQLLIQSDPRSDATMQSEMSSMMGWMMGIGLLGWVLVIALLVTVLFALVQLLTQRGLGADQRSSSPDAKANRVRE
jgi:hypothetical protein